MDALLDNAQRIFEVACAGQSPEDCGGEEGETQDFALLIRPDGGLHFVMESPFSIEAAAIHAGAHSAYRVTRSRDGVRVQGMSAGKRVCVEARNTRRELLPDQALYSMTSPLLTSSALEDSPTLAAFAGYTSPPVGLSGLESVMVPAMRRA